MKTVIKKHFIEALALLLIAFLMPLPHGSATNITETTYVEDLGNGITVDSILLIEDDMPRSSSKSATLVSTFKNNGIQIAEITLTANFVYDGSTSRATYASYSKNISNGWTYTNHTLSRSGGSATLTATIKKNLINVPVNMKISCSPSGVISKS